MTGFPEILITAIAGLILGSFATALIYRVPLGIPWIVKDRKVQRSFCPQCRKVLSARDLIPLYSWLAAKGRCRHCGGKISTLYPLVELGVLCAALGIYGVYGFTIQSLLLIAVLPFLAALLVIDLQSMILPDILILAAGLIGLIRLIAEGFIAGTLNPALIGMNYVLGAFVYVMLAWSLGKALSATLKREVLGWGDIKFFGVAGLWLGLSGLAWFCILAGALGIIFSGCWRAGGKDRIFPFGPALIVSVYALLLVQGSLLR